MTLYRESPSPLKQPTVRAIKMRSSRKPRAGPFPRWLCIPSFPHSQPHTEIRDMSSQALQILTKRRTQYALGRNVQTSKEEVTGLIKEAIRQAPSSFNSQSSRAVLLFGEQSEKFWSLTKEALRAMVPVDQFASTEKKMDGFAAGIGTVLFYEDQDVIKDLQQTYPLYAGAFPGFSAHSAGMAQYAVWTVLADAGIGASLQHYSQVIEAAAANAWNVPASWVATAQMPFGSNEAPIGEKSFIDDTTRFIVAG